LRIPTPEKIWTTMREQLNCKSGVIGVILTAASWGILPSARAHGKVLEAMFTPAPIRVDGQPDALWSKAAAADISICMNAGLKAQLDRCTVSGTVKAMWNGPLLYLLFTVTDADISTSSSKDTERSGVQIFVDQFDDKFPKFEEDDGYVIISAAGQQTGNRTNAGLMYYPAAWSSHLKSFGTAFRYDSSGKKIGYTVEVGWSIGDLALKNGTKLGMEFAINAVSSAAKTPAYQLFWSSGNNKGTDDNTMWGDVVLSGYDGVAPMELNTFMLEENIRKASASSSSATGLVRGIWTDESEVDHALAAARSALQAASAQAEIDAANAALDHALRALRRSGKYPDPYDLPAVDHLPDPFTFFNGKKVHSVPDWEKRRAEIKDLAQYYEFGYMPAPPQLLKAESTPDSSGALKFNSITVTVEDGGKSSSFKPILYLPTGGAAPYPVIVEEDFAASPKYSPPNSVFLQGGYAVLSIPTWDNRAFGVTGLASDDGNHTGAFFALYPYQLDSAGNDRGVLLAWAWGARS
jgi:endo-1,4-beta-xylanase